MKMNKVINILSICVLICIFSVSCKKNEYVNDGHEHTFSNKWTYDENFHWKKASCSGSWDCDVRIANKEAHKIGDWVPDTDLIKSSGKITEKKECSVCGMKETRTCNYPVFEAVDANGEGVKLKFYLQTNTQQITIYKGKGNGRSIYYSRMSSWSSSGFSEKEIEWTDPYVNDGESYYYYIFRYLEDKNTGYNSYYSDTVTVKSNGGKGELKITNTPGGYFDESTNSIVLTTLPVYSIANCGTRILFNTSEDGTWWTDPIDAITNTTNISWPFGDNTAEKGMKSFGIAGDITYSGSSWPYSGYGELFYRTPAFTIQEKNFTWKKY